MSKGFVGSTHKIGLSFTPIMGFFKKINTRLSGTLRIQRALQLIWKINPKLVIINNAFLIVLACLPLLALYVIKLIIDTITIGLHDKVMVDALFLDVLQLIAYAAIIAILMLILRLISGLVQEYQSQLIVDKVYSMLHKKSTQVDLDFYENPQNYNAMHRAQSDAPHRPSTVVSSLSQVVYTAISLVVVLALLVSFHWTLVIILFLAALPSLVVQLSFTHQLFGWMKRRTSMDRMSFYYHHILTASKYAKELRIFGLGNFFSGRFLQLRKCIREEQLNINKRKVMAESFAQFIGVVAIFAALIFLSYKAIYGIITIGSLLMYFYTFQRGLDALRGFLSALANLYESNLYLSCLDDFLDLKVKVKEPLSPTKVPTPWHCIKLSCIAFNYPNSQRHVLKNISISIKQGEHIALVGENGSGKTTLAKLLCRFYEPDHGSITIDDMAIQQFSPAEYRAQITALFQDYNHYYLTAKENILMGDIALGDEDPKIYQAAQRSGIHDLIMGLPQQYNNPLGKAFSPDGEELSVGQWQKIAVARAFLRNAQLIILDEPSSSLDAQAEYKLFQEFQKLADGKSAVLISHRLSTIRSVNRIYMLENGVISESGTHEALMMNNGAYARLFNMQAKGYRL